MHVFTVARGNKAQTQRKELISLRHSHPLSATTHTFITRTNSAYSALHEPGWAPSRLLQTLESRRRGVFPALASSPLAWLAYKETPTVNPLLSLLWCNSSHKKEMSQVLAARPQLKLAEEMNKSQEGIPATHTSPQWGREDEGGQGLNM